MQFLNFIRDDPVMGWFAVLAALLVVVPVLSLVWRRLSGRPLAANRVAAVVDPKAVRFGNQTELLLLFLGAIVLLAVLFLGKWGLSLLRAVLF